MAIAKIWRNRVEAGTQMLSNCPVKYKDVVIGLIQGDIENGDFTKDQLKALVASGMMTEEEYEQITGEDYNE